MMTFGDNMPQILNRMNDLQHALASLPFAGTLIGKTCLVLLFQAGVMALACIATPLLVRVNMGGIFSSDFTLFLCRQELPSFIGGALMIIYGLSYLVGTAIIISMSLHGTDFAHGMLGLGVWGVATASALGAVFLGDWDFNGAKLLLLGIAILAAVNAVAVVIGVCLVPFEVSQLSLYLIGAAVVIVVLLSLDRLLSSISGYVFTCGLPLLVGASLGVTFADSFRAACVESANTWDQAMSLAMMITLGIPAMVWKGIVKQLLR